MYSISRLYVYTMCIHIYIYIYIYCNHIYIYIYRYIVTSCVLFTCVAGFDTCIVYACLCCVSVVVCL